MIALLCRSSILLVAMSATASVQPAFARASAALTELSAQLAEGGDIHFTGDLICEEGSGSGDSRNAYAGSDADTLVRLAQHRTIYIYAHGFYNRNPRRTKPPLEYAQDTWAQHLALVRRRGAPYAACLLVSDTASGFGAHQPTLGDFLFGLRALTDSDELFDAKRRIVMVGYSAGANYVKQGLVTYASHLQANGLEPAGIRPTRMTLAFLGGIHHGTDLTNLVGAAITLADLISREDERKPRSYEESSDQRWREHLRSEREALVTSRGAAQLTRGNQELEQLNLAFQAALTPNVRVINAISTADFVAPPTATTLSFIPSTVVADLSHWGFVTAPLSSSALKIAEEIYRER